MGAHDTLADTIGGLSGWSMELGGNARFVTVAHVAGAVCEVHQPEPDGLWVADVGRPGKMSRAEGRTPEAALWLAVVGAKARPDAAREVLNLPNWRASR